MSQFITTYSEAGQTRTYCIEEGASTFAGNAGHCEIQLEGSGVEPIHCMFSSVDGELKIQDWNTNGKTLLNGQALVDESPFAESDEVTIGGNRIVVGQFGETNQTVDNANERSSNNPSSDEGDDNLRQELERIRNSNSELEAEFASFEESSNSFDSLFDDPFAGGDTDLLRTEIETLQMDLVERDQQILMLKQQLESGGGSGDMEETTRLVTRMEELLDELQSADERVRIHEELLRASDEATQAEKEERRQLEAWVEQIEHRVTARDEESKAEIERLNLRIRDFIAQQKRQEQVLEKALQQRGAGSGNGGPADELVESLQTQVQELQQNWQQSQEQCEQLAKQLSAGVGEDSATVVELQQKVMQLELDASRERAEVARERAELAQLQSELEKQCKSKDVSSDSEIRLKAMREHLREIHSEEESEREARRQRSLSGRIASLFSRIESR